MTDNSNEAKKDIILAVDDEIMNLMAIEELLGTLYDVRTAPSGETALEMARKERPDLVLLDLHMSGMNGLQVLKALHETEGYETIPVVFLTADDDADTEVAIFEAGAMDYIRKPFVMQVALQRIRHALELTRLQDSLQEEVERKTAALKESNRMIRELSDQVVQALAGAIDAKDPYTNGHSNRVAEYSRELARRLGKSESEQEDIYNIALLHDVGKVGVDDAIINKPAKLTAEEYEQIKSHTVKGYDILRTISDMPALTIGARWHHERFDGHGYPDGLSGSDIPEIARIICVADCYDAMSSDRSYRKALAPEVVRQELESNSGTQFDPVIARVMLDIMGDRPG